MAGRTQSTKDSELVKVAYANDQSEAELIQGLLSSADVSSVVRRAPGFDVPEFLAGGAREVLVDASEVPAARDILREVHQTEPPPPSSAVRPSRVLAGMLIVVALVAFVVCVATDVIL